MSCVVGRWGEGVSCLPGFRLAARTTDCYYLAYTKQLLLATVVMTKLTGLVQDTKSART